MITGQPHRCGSPERDARKPLARRYMAALDQLPTTPLLHRCVALTGKGGACTLQGELPLRRDAVDGLMHVDPGTRGLRQFSLHGQPPPAPGPPVRGPGSPAACRSGCVGDPPAADGFRRSRPWRCVATIRSPAGARDGAMLGVAFSAGLRQEAPSPTPYPRSERDPSRVRDLHVAFFDPACEQAESGQLLQRQGLG